MTSLGPRLFGREVSVTLAQRGVVVGPDGFAVASIFNTDGTTVGLRIHFRATKTISEHPANLDLAIYNLAPAGRRRLATENGLVVLKAGYHGNTSIIFKGVARSVDHLREGPHWVTHVQCGDGEVAYQHSYVAMSFAAGTLFTDVLIALADAVRKADDTGSLDVSRFVAKVRSGTFNDTGPGFTLGIIGVPIPAKQFVHGFSVAGSAYRELAKLLRGIGYQLMIQEGVLTTLRDTAGRFETTETVVKLSAATGLIGSPEHLRPKSPGVPTLLHAKSLLQPTLNPGDRLQLDALELKGDYRIEKISHVGDTAGPEWTSELEARPFPQSL